MFIQNTWLYKSIVLALKMANYLLPVPKPILLTGKDSSLQLVPLIEGAKFRRVMIVTDKVLI